MARTCVVATFDLTFDYRKYNIAFQATKRCRLHSHQSRPYCPVEGGELPDCASVIAALEAVTLKKIDVIVYKPSPITVQVALEVMGLEEADCILIGDRLEMGIRMGLESGMKTALVLSSVTDGKMLETAPLHPDHMFQSIADMEFSAPVSQAITTRPAPTL